MRRMKLLIGALGLGLGVIVGTLGVSLLSDPSSPGSFISKIRGQDSIQTVAGATTDSTSLNPVKDALSATNDALYNGNADLISSQIEQQIVSDYKQDIGIFFGAWKSADMDTFRLKLAKAYTCLLYTSDAADEEDSVDLGGRRIIKKKKKNNKS